jgi:putative hydrolase of the HAD superfamily
MIKAVIFDFDGLIVDTEHAAYQAWEDIYQEHGVHLDLAVWSSCIGGFGGEFHSCDHLVSLTGCEVDRESVRKRRNQRKRELIAREPLREGVLQLLNSARTRNLKIGLASSSGLQYISEILQHHRILDYFDEFATGDQATKAKPHPELYQLVLQKLRVSAANSLALEDSPNGFLSASAAGLRCLVIPNAITAQLRFPPETPLLRSLLEVDLDT